MSGAWSALRGTSADGYPVPTDAYGRWATEAQRYDVLDAYEANDRLYRRIASELSDAGYEGYQGFRSPASRVVELYVAKLTDRLIDSLDTGTDDGLKTRITQIYEWSNWVDRAEDAARDLVTYGDVFVKVESVREDPDDVNSPFVRVQRNVLDPRHVTDFETDGRDILTHLRLDVPYEKELGRGEVEERVVTELWDKPDRLYRAWDHDLDPGADLEDIANTASGHSELIESAVLATAEDASFATGEHVTGYDFIPVVYRKIRGRRSQERGRGVFQHALDSIDELNRQATKLSQMMFPDVYAVLERDPSARGGDLPAPQIEVDGSGASAGNPVTRAQQNQYRVVDVAGVRTARLPSGVRMGWSIPQHDFSGHLQAMDNFQRESIEKDIPELAYYRLREMGDVSGRAAVILMMDVSDRIKAVRRKFEDLEVRLNKMALTVAKATGIPGFESVGDYAEGELDHRFKPYQLFPASLTENAEEGQAEASAITSMQSLPEPVLRRFLEKQGYEQKDIDAIVSALSAGSEPSGASSILERIRERRSQGAETPTPNAALRETGGG